MRVRRLSTFPLFGLLASSSRLTVYTISFRKQCLKIPHSLSSFSFLPLWRHPKGSLRSAAAPEVVPPDDKENAPVAQPDIRSHYYRSNADTGGKTAPKQQRICGLLAKLFWATMLGLVTILAAGIGGGVGGGLAARNKR